MKPNCHWLWMIPFVVFHCTKTATAGSAPVAPGICIHVYNYASVPALEITRARAAAANALAQAGIETGWVEFLASPGEVREVEAAERLRATVLQDGSSQIHRAVGCNAGGQGPTHLTLIIYPRAMAQELQLPAGTLGVALLPNQNQKGQFPNRASVLFGRVKLLKQMPGTSRALYLGLAMAHEIGHLLLGAQSHSPAGIMRAPWRRFELQRAATGMLHFTPGEAKRMRRQVQARIQAENGGAPAASASENALRRTEPM